MQRCLFLILTICLVSCNNEKNKFLYTKEQIKSLQLDSTKILKTELDSLTNININPFLKPKSFDFESLVKEIKLVPLETTDKSLLDNIRKTVVTNSNIYIYDDFKGGGIVIFDNEGNFIKRIPNGRGPGELNNIYSISFDNQTNKLVIYQHPFLLFFKPNGEFFEQKRLPFGFYNFEVIPNGYLFKTFDSQGNGHLENFKKFRFIVTDKKFEIKSVGLSFDNININLSVPNNIFKNTDGIYITQRFVDTIYKYNYAKNTLKAKYILNNRKNIPYQYLNYSWKKFSDVAKKNDYYFFLGEYLDTGSHHFFSLISYFTNKQTILYRNKKTGNLRGGTTANFDSNQLPFMAFPSSSYEGYFISYHYPNEKDNFFHNSSIISDSDKIKMKEINENSNPVLVFFKLKEF